MISVHCLVLALFLGEAVFIYEIIHLEKVSFTVMAVVVAPVVLSCVLYGLSMLLSYRASISWENGSPYECGFSPFCVERQSISINFFLMAILFVIFDVELCLLVPVIFSLNMIKSCVAFVSLLIFILILFYGLVHEYREGSLEWVS